MTGDAYARFVLCWSRLGFYVALIEIVIDESNERVAQEKSK